MSRISLGVSRLTAWALEVNIDGRSRAAMTKSTSAFLLFMIYLPEHLFPYRDEGNPWIEPLRRCLSAGIGASTDRQKATVHGHSISRSLVEYIDWRRSIWNAQVLALLEQYEDGLFLW
jgi:hypothetical protein